MPRAGGSSCHFENTMPDISKHPILGQISELMHAIEECGASPQLTRAVSLAEGLYKPAEALVDAKVLPPWAVGATAAQHHTLPPATDEELEHDIKESKADIAPRVTVAHIDEMMARVIYTYEFRPHNSALTFCHALLDGTFHLASGVSGCISPENYNARIGQQIAFDNASRLARDKLWELEGYRLKMALTA